MYGCKLELEGVWGRLCSWYVPCSTEARRDRAKEADLSTGGLTFRETESAPPVLASLAPSLLPLLLPPVLAYIPPSPSASHSTPPPPYPSSLLSADLSLLTIAVQTLESQTLDSPSWQSTLHSLSEFTLLLDFIDRATLPVLLPPDEDDDDDEETSEEDRQKTFGSLKGGVVKSVVAAFSDDSVGKEVFARGKEEGGEMERLMGWLGEGEREDMVICAVLSLGNLARSGQSSPPLTSSPSLVFFRLDQF